MNYTPLSEAYQIHHTNKQTYQVNIVYNPKCIFCPSVQSVPLMLNQDGGSFRKCVKCNKHFQASIQSAPIQNYSYSTHHLQGTN